MTANQDEVNNLNKMIDEIMFDNVKTVGEAQSETQPEEEVNAEKGNQPEEEEQLEREKTEEEKDFISQEAKELWNKVMFDKDFVCERGFGKLISPFSEVITKIGWEFLCEHKAPGFSALPREFYANMVGMKDDYVFVRGVWVPFDDRSINEVFKLRDYKHGSKYKKLLESPNYKKIVDLLTGEEGKWEVTKKNPHHAIKRGALTEEAKVWFYFICSVIVPTRHLCTVKEQEAILLYAFLKGYKINMGMLNEESIKGYHHSNKRGLIPHPSTITRLCFRAGVKGNWEEEERCPRVPPLNLTGVTKGPKGKKQKEVMVLYEEKGQEIDTETDRREVEEMPDSILPEAEEEPLRISPTYPLSPEVQEQVPVQAKTSRSIEGTAENNEKGNGGKRTKMGKATKDQRRISRGYNQKEGAIVERKLENNRRRTQRRVEKTRREDDGQNTDMHASFLQ